MRGSQHERRILVVDDEATVRLVIQRMLEEDGYHVYEARDGRAALDFVRTAPELLDLVVADISMPRLNGIALMQVLAVENPELPCVLISGYAPPELERFGLTPPCGVMRKPLVEPEFLAEVRRCLRNRN
ncbi:MAG: response regulator [Gemmatimonadales bacterium]